LRMRRGELELSVIRTIRCMCSDLQLAADGSSATLTSSANAVCDLQVEPQRRIAIPKSSRAGRLRPFESLTIMEISEWFLMEFVMTVQTLLVALMPSRATAVATGGGGFLPSTDGGEGASLYGTTADNNQMRYLSSASRTRMSLDLESMISWTKLMTLLQLSVSGAKTLSWSWAGSEKMVE
jgi:hypothetical protein